MRTYGPTFRVISTAIVAVATIALLPSCGHATKSFRSGGATVESATPEQKVATSNQQPTTVGQLTSVEAFKLTVYPLATAHCAGCHNKAQAPFFAASDVNAAHDSLTKAMKVDFSNIEMSRLIMRLSADRHNCWGDCSANSIEMKRAVILWLAKMTALEGPKPGADPALDSVGLAMANATTKTIPLDPGTIVLDMTKTVVVAPMVQRNDANTATRPLTGGNFYNTPKSGATPPLVLMPADPMAGSITLKFNTTIAGDYTVWGLTNAPDEARSTFYISVDGSTPVLWATPVNAQNFSWNAASPSPGSNGMVFPLTAGAHTVAISQRDGGAGIAKVVVTNDLAFDGRFLAARDVKVLKFPLESILKVSDAFLEIEISQFDATSYEFQRPRLLTGSQSVQVKDLQILVNDVAAPQNATYRVVDKTIAPPGGVLSPSAMTVLFDKGVATDVFKLRFGTLKVP